MKNKAFNEFLISLLMLSLGVGFFILNLSISFYLILACSLISVAYSVSSMITGIKQLRKQEGERYRNYAAVWGGCVVTLAYLFFVIFLSQID
jgi:hypothetical protein